MQQYLAPFSFTFPGQGACRQRQLPPTTDTVIAKVRVIVEYAVTVTVHWKRACGLRATTRARHALRLTSGSVMDSFPRSVSASLPTLQLLCAESEQGQGFDPICSVREWLPPYSPSLILQALLVPSPVMAAGQETKVRLILHSPSQLVASGNVYVTSIDVRYQTSVTVVVDGACCRRATERRSLLAVKGLIRVTEKAMELDGGLWSSHVLQDTLPSCNSLVLNVTHSVEVVVGVARGRNADRVQVRVFVLG